MTKPSQPSQPSLLDKARAIGRRSTVREKISDDDINLALAWARGEVTITQTFMAWEMKTSGAAYVKLSHALAQYIRNNNL